MLEMGADKVSVNTAAVDDPKLNQRGRGSVSARSASCCRSTPGGCPAMGRAGRSSSMAGARPPGATPWSGRARRWSGAAGELMVTSMDADGHQSGYDLPLLRAISEVVEVPLIASGGAGKPEHLYDALTEGGADAVLAASIFHFGTVRYRHAEALPERAWRPDAAAAGRDRGGCYCGRRGERLMAEVGERSFGEYGPRRPALRRPRLRQRGRAGGLHAGGRDGRRDDRADAAAHAGAGAGGVLVAHARRAVAQGRHLGRLPQRAEHHHQTATRRRCCSRSSPLPASSATPARTPTSWRPTTARRASCAPEPVVANGTIS